MIIVGFSQCFSERHQIKHQTLDPRLPFSPIMIPSDVTFCLDVVLYRMKGRDDDDDRRKSH